MAKKAKSESVADPDGQTQATDNIDLEDDVTSQLLRSVTADSSSYVRIAPRIVHENEGPLEPDLVLSDRYEIIKLVHSGGMGHVYKAIDRRRQRESRGQIHVAIKMLRESLSDRDEYRMILEREATKARSLSHPNIIKIFNFDQHDGRFFIVMEWLEGESVNALLRRTKGQRLSPQFAWQVIEGAAAAIHHAHINNVVHADINPSNIFITATKDIKLLDFGVARCANDFHDPADDWDAWVTQTYASPEVLSGLPPEFKDDVFSLGCVAYRLLADKHPFAGSPSIEAKRAGIAVERIPGLPNSDWQIIDRALEYAPSERPDTVEDFLRKPRAAAEVSAGATETETRADYLRWTLPVVAAAVAVVAVGFWFRPDVWMTNGIPEDTQAVIREADPVVPPTEPADPAEAPLVNTMLVAARRAEEEQRLVQPDDDNAREWYRQALSVEPDNPEALRGLRSISDTFVEQASSALKSGDPQTAAAQLAIASETDADNPAIRIIADLLVAKGDAELAAARAAAAANNVGEANAALARAEDYAHIDTAAINAVREQLDRLALENALLDGFAVVDRHIAANRLLAPAGNNARETLAALADRYADDPRFSAANERLAERLLTQAAFAIAAGSFAEAVPLIDAADSLGALDAEVDLAYERLAAATAIREVLPQAEKSEARETLSTADVSPARDDNMNAVREPEQTEPPADSVSAGNQAITPAPRQVTATRLDDLGLERFVAPTFPRRAQRLRLRGYVEVSFDVDPIGLTKSIEIIRSEPNDVFDDSAAAAVRKWRFAPRQDTVRASVVLRFEPSE